MEVNRDVVLSVLLSGLATDLTATVFIVSMKIYLIFLCAQVNNLFAQEITSCSKDMGLVCTSEFDVLT